MVAAPPGGDHLMPSFVDVFLLRIKTPVKCWDKLNF